MEEQLAILKRLVLPKADSTVEQAIRIIEQDVAKLKKHFHKDSDQTLHKNDKNSATVATTTQIEEEKTNNDTEDEIFKLFSKPTSSAIAKDFFKNTSQEESDKWSSFQSVYKFLSTNLAFVLDELDKLKATIEKKEKNGNLSNSSIDNLTFRFLGLTINKDDRSVSCARISDVQGFTVIELQNSKLMKQLLSNDNIRDYLIIWDSLCTLFRSIKTDNETPIDLANECSTVVSQTIDFICQENEGFDHESEKLGNISAICQSLSNYWSKFTTKEKKKLYGHYFDTYFVHKVTLTIFKNIQRCYRFKQLKQKINTGNINDDYKSDKEIDSLCDTALYNIDVLGVQKEKDAIKNAQNKKEAKMSDYSKIGIFPQLRYGFEVFMDFAIYHACYIDMSNFTGAGGDSSNDTNDNKKSKEKGTSASLYKQPKRANVNVESIESLHIWKYFLLRKHCFNLNFLRNLVYYHKDYVDGTLLHNATTANFVYYCDVLLKDGFNVLKKNKWPKTFGGALIIGPHTSYEVATSIQRAAILSKFNKILENAADAVENESKEQIGSAADSKNESNSSKKSEDSGIERSYFKFKNQRQSAKFLLYLMGFEFVRNDEKIMADMNPTDKSLYYSFDKMKQLQKQRLQVMEETDDIKVNSKDIKNDSKASGQAKVSTHLSMERMVQSVLGQIRNKRMSYFVCAFFCPCGVCCC